MEPLHIATGIAICIAISTKGPHYKPELQINKCTHVQVEIFNEPVTCVTCALQIYVFSVRVFIACRTRYSWELAGWIIFRLSLFVVWVLPDFFST